MGETNDISSESTHQIHSQKHAYSLGGFVPKLFKELRNFKFGFLTFFFFLFVNMGAHGSKKFQTTSPLKVCTRFAPHNSCVLLGSVSIKVARRIVKL